MPAIVNRPSVPLGPQDIYVYPDPLLELDYFLQRDVIGDDPNAPGTITPQPFNLGLMVRNEGYGTAYNFQVTSAQPQIVCWSNRPLNSRKSEPSTSRYSPSPSLCVNAVGPRLQEYGQHVQRPY